MHAAAAYPRFVAKSDPPPRRLLVSTDDESSSTTSHKNPERPWSGSSHTSAQQHRRRRMNKPTVRAPTQLPLTTDSCSRDNDDNNPGVVSSSSSSFSDGCQKRSRAPPLYTPREKQQDIVRRRARHTLKNDRAWERQETAGLHPVLESRRDHNTSSFASPRRGSAKTGAEEDRSPLLPIGLLSQQYTYEELVDATNGFDPRRKLGKGACGAVYSGTLRSGTDIAVKVIKTREASNGFEEEVRVLSRCRHPNLVTLLGWAEHDAHRFIVYEFLPGGDLCGRLERVSSSSDNLFRNWTERLRIALETCQGVSYLHSCRPKVFHRDIKAANVLLTEHGTAKLADFGLACVARDTDSSCVVRPEGTPGYADPTYIRTLEINESREVYSLGMLMLELLTARPPAVYVKNHRGDEVLKYFLDEIVPGFVDSVLPLLDTSLDIPKHIAERWIALSFRCTARDESHRPRSADIVRELRELLKLGGSRTTTDNRSEGAARNSRGLFPAHHRGLHHNGGRLTPTAAPGGPRQQPPVMGPQQKSAPPTLSPSRCICERELPRLRQTDRVTDGQQQLYAFRIVTGGVSPDLRVLPGCTLTEACRALHTQIAAFSVHVGRRVARRPQSTPIDFVGDATVFGRKRAAFCGRLRACLTEDMFSCVSRQHFTIAPRLRLVTPDAPSLHKAFEVQFSFTCLSPNGTGVNRRAVAAGDTVPLCSGDLIHLFNPPPGFPDVPTSSPPLRPGARVSPGRMKMTGGGGDPLATTSKTTLLFEFIVDHQQLARLKHYVVSQCLRDLDNVVRGLTGRSHQATPPPRNTTNMPQQPSILLSAE